MPVPDRPRRPHRPRATRTSSWSRTRPPRPRGSRSCWPASRHVRRGRVGGVVERPARQRRAGRRRLGGGLQRRLLGRRGQRGRPAPRGVLRVEPAGRGALRRPARRRVAHRRHRRELLPPGRGRRDPGRHGPRGRGGGAGRLPALRAGPGRRAAVDVRVPGAERRRRCPSCSWSTPPSPTDVCELPGRRSTPTARSGSTSGPISCSADPTARWAALLLACPSRSWPSSSCGRSPTSSARACAATARLGPLRGGEVLGDPALRSGRVVHARGRRPPRPSLTLAVGLPVAQVLARYEFPGRRLVQALRRGALRAPDRGGRGGVPRPPRAAQPARGRSPRHGVRRSCSPTRSSTWPWSCAPSAGSGRASTRAPRRRPACWVRSRWRAFRR